MWVDQTGSVPWVCPAPAKNDGLRMWGGLPLKVSKAKMGTLGFAQPIT